MIDNQYDVDVVLWCAHRGGHTLARSVCAPPCEATHLRCTRCDAAIGGCPFERPEHHERLLALVSAVSDADEPEQLRTVALVERAARRGHPLTWDAARLAARRAVTDGGRGAVGGRHRAPGRDDAAVDSAGAAGPVPGVGRPVRAGVPT